LDAYKVELNGVGSRSQINADDNCNINALCIAYFSFAQVGQRYMPTPITNPCICFALAEILWLQLSCEVFEHPVISYILVYFRLLICCFSIVLLFSSVTYTVLY